MTNNDGPPWAFVFLWFIPSVFVAAAAAHDRTNGRRTVMSWLEASSSGNARQNSFVRRQWQAERGNLRGKGYPERNRVHDPTPRLGRTS